MKKACDNLEQSFAEAEKKLDRVTLKVDETIAKVETNSSAPSKLLKNLNEIKEEHKALSSELQNLKETQESFVKDILSDLKKVEEAEAELIKKVGGEAVLGQN